MWSSLRLCSGPFAKNASMLGRHVRCAFATSAPQAHNELVRAEFAKQAQSGYGSSKWWTDMEYEPKNAQTHNEWMMSHIPVDPMMHVLDVASGTGICARELAPHVSSVVGVDQTPEMLAEAEKFAVASNLANVRFVCGDAHQLPFDDASFDLVTNRLGLHHFHDPQSAIKEMARVVKPGGKIAIIELATYNEPEMAERYNHFERLRDPSHTRAFSITQWCGLLEAAQLRVLPGCPSRTFPVNVNGWMDVTQTSQTSRQEILAAMSAEMQPASSTKETGMRPHTGPNGQLYWFSTWTTLIAEKPRVA